MNDPKVPKYVYLMRNDTFLQTEPPWLAPVIDLQERKKLYENRTQNRAELAVWMGPMMGAQNWILLLQFFEYYRLHGVTKFFVQKRYTFSKFTQRLLSYYYQLGLIHMNSWEAHFVSCNRYSAWHCSSVNQKQEGVFSTSYFYKYLLMIDFDELLQPVNHSLTLLDFIREKDVEKPNTGAFIFGAQYHTTDVTSPFRYRSNPETWEDISEESLHQNLPLIHWNNISDAFHPHSPKAIVKPETIKRMWIHGVDEFFSRKDHISQTMSQSKHCTIHHFKNASTWKDLRDIRNSGHQLRDPSQFFNTSFVDKLVTNMAYTLKKMYWTL